MKSPKFSERGQAIIIIVLAMVGLVAIVGLAIDGSAKFADRRHAQNAADTAAMAAALAKSDALVKGVSNNSPTTNAPATCPPPAGVLPSPVCETLQLTGLDRAVSNGYDNDLATNTVRIYSPPISGYYQDDEKYIQVIITSITNTTFARVLGIDQLESRVEAVTMSDEGYTGELYGGAAVVGLAPDQCKTIWFSGSALTNITGGGVYSNSSLDCGLTIQGSTNIDMDGSIDMVADAFTQNGNPPLGNIDGGFGYAADPYEYPPPAKMLPKPTCGGPALKSGNTMSPGYWSGNFPPNNVKTLLAGTYCINGNFKLNGGDILTGTGVTIYMQSGGIDWNGGAKVTLSAPTSGDLAGLLIYAPMSNSSNMKFNGNASSLLEGTIFMPAAPIVYNGTGNVNPSHVQIIGYTVELTGSNATNVIYTDGGNWDTTIPAQVGLMN